MELNLKFDEQLLTKVCNKMLDEYEYNGKTIREWADRISNPKTKADRIRSMSDEELAEWIVAIIAQETIYSARKVPTPDYAIEMRQRWLDWLRQECE